MNAAVPVGAILVGLDESAESARALSWAATEADRRHWPLHLMHVVNDLALMSTASPATHSPMRPVLRDALIMLSDRHPRLEVTWSQLAGDPAACLTNGARAARVTVVGSRGHGAVSDAVHGSVTTRLLARTHCPVAVLRADTPVPHADATVVVGIGYDTSCSPVLEAGFQEAGNRHVDLVVVHAWQLDASTIVDDLELQGLPPDEAQKHEAALLKRTIAGLARDHPEVEVSSYAVQDGAAHALARYAADAALLVVGSRGRGEISGAVLGSVSQSAIRSVGCPVLVVRAGGRAVTAAPDEKTVGARS